MKKCCKYGHQNLSTYGIGKELTRKQWLHIAQQLVQKGLLEQSNDLYRVLQPDRQGHEVLRSTRADPGYAATGRAGRHCQRKKAGEIEYDRDLFDLLRQSAKSWPTPPACRPT